MKWKDESELFEAIKASIAPDLKKPARDNDVYDAISESKKAVIEFKVRKKHYDGLMIEKKKYTSLVELSSRLGFSCIYINCTPKGVWSFNLSKMDEPKWFKKRLHNKTQWSTKRKRVTKEIALLDIKDAKDISVSLKTH
jgi:hypothetical protein